MVAKPENGITVRDVIQLHLHASSLERDFWRPSDPEWSMLAETTKNLALKLKAVREATQEVLKAAQRCPTRDGDG